MDTPPDSDTSALTPPEALDLRRLFTIAAVALAVRLAWGLLVPVEPISDCHAYDLLARSLAAGDGYAFTPGEPSAFWPPGTSAIYAACYVVFGVGYVAPVIVNALFGAGTVALLYLVVHRWHGPRAATWAAGVLALWPEQVQFTTVLASELPFGFLLVLALAVWTWEARSLWTRAALCGVVLALACFVRGVAQLLPFVLGLSLAARERKGLGRIALASVACFALMTLVVLPWSLRNHRAYGKFVFVSANLGGNLWMGNNPESDGGFMRIPPRHMALKPVTVRDAAMKAEAIAHIKAEPLRFVGRCFQRLWKTHDRETHGVSWNPGLKKRPGAWSITPLKAASSLYWWAVLLLALGGVALLARERRWWVLGHPAVLLWGYFAGIHTIVVGGDRYHMPSVPLIAALAAVSLAALERRFRKTPASPSTT